VLTGRGAETDPSAEPEAARPSQGIDGADGHSRSQSSPAGRGHGSEAEAGVRTLSQLALELSHEQFHDRDALLVKLESEPL